MTWRVLPLAGALTALLTTLATPAFAQDALDELPARDAAAPEQPDLPPASAKLNLALTGIGVTAGFYGGALGASLLWSKGPWAPDARIPVAGPWLAMTHFRCGSGEPNCSTAVVTARFIAAALDGVGQVGGLALILESLLLPTRTQSQARARRLHEHAWVTPVPFVAGGDAIGLGLVGEL